MQKTNQKSKRKTPINLKGEGFLHISAGMSHGAGYQKGKINAREILSNRCFDGILPSISDKKYTIADYRKYYEEVLKTSETDEEFKADFLRIVEELEKEENSKKANIKTTKLIDSMISKSKNDDLNV